MITWSRFAGMELQPVQVRQILPYYYIWKFNFVLAGGKIVHLVFVYICMHFLWIFLYKHVGLRNWKPILLRIFLNWSVNFFILLRWAETISWESFVPAIQNRDAVLPGWNFFTGCNLWRVYNTTGIPTKQDRISSLSIGIM